MLMRSGEIRRRVSGNATAGLAVCANQDTAKILTSLLSVSSSVSSPALPASEPATEVSVGKGDATVVETVALVADDAAVALWAVAGSAEELVSTSSGPDGPGHPSPGRMIS